MRRRLRSSCYLERDRKSDNEYLRTYKALVGSFGMDLRRSETFDDFGELDKAMTVIAVKVDWAAVIGVHHSLSVPNAMLDTGGFERVANLIEL